MSRLVVVSNRVADPRKLAAGGLAVALGEALSSSGGLWFGWSGNVRERGTADGPLHTQRAGEVTLATVDLGHDDHAAYYRGYANGVLWPVFHYRLDLADFEAGYIDGYRRVNRMFAHKLMGLLQPDDVIWVHDYHLIPMAAELRAMGCQQRIGFFLHTPLPPPLILAAIPGHEWLMRALFAYDLVGLQSQADMNHLSRYLVTEAGAERLGEGRFGAFNRSLSAAAFPIGIDVDSFVELGRGKDALETRAKLSERHAQGQLLVGVDRLDYSKGLPQRFRAFRRLLERYPENREHATLIQIAAPSREDVDAYSDIRRELEGLCGAINGDFGDLGLDAHPLHPPNGRAQARAGTLRGQPRRPGHAAARRHEPRGQGIRRVTGPGGPRRPGALALRGRGRAADRRAARQPVRHPGHRRCHRARTAHAAGGTSHAPPAAARGGARTRRALVARAFPRRADEGLRRLSRHTGPRLIAPERVLPFAIVLPDAMP